LPKMHRYKQGKRCHSLEGRDATAFKSIQIDMENAGVNFTDKEVVVCLNQLVISRTHQ